MDHQVRVTLTALNGEFSIAQRTLTLNAIDNTIPVGRASKSVTKGILGAADNAWFDSPVMSRNHASIEFNPEDMTVTIQDIGSMHGTYLNDFELAKDSPTVITDNDILVFGAEVRRGPEIFPACSFRVNNKFVPSKAANTFAFPESSDVEEDGEDNYDEFSEDDMEIEEREQRYSSEDGVSIFSATRKQPSQASGAIDLTGDDFPPNSADQGDLTGETDAERRMMDVKSGRPEDIGENADPVSIGMYAGNDPIVLDSDDEGEDEDADFSSDLDEQSEDNVSRDSDRPRIRVVFEDDSDEIGDAENEGSDGDLDMDSDDEPIPHEIKPTVISNLTRYAAATVDNPVIHLSDVRTRLEPPNSDDDEDEDEDDESDFGLSEASEAGADGMKALHGVNTSLFNQDTPEFEQENEPEAQNPAEGISPQVFLSSTQHLGLSASVIARKISETHNQENLLTPLSIIRQPSPSDAAMVKSAVQTKKVSICDLGNSGEYSPQAMGEKSGKPAFFAAREVNKAKFGFDEQNRTLNAFQAANRTINAFIGPPKSRKGTESSTSMVYRNALGQLTQRGMPAAEQSANTVFGTFEAEPSIPTYVGSMNPVSSIPTRDYCSFLDQPDQTPILNRTPSPLPDMTSSFSYNTSKDTMMPNPIPLHNARSAIKITDIVESSSPSIGTNALKRKSENISSVVDNELRTWAISNVSSEVPASAASAPLDGKRSNDVSNISEAPRSKRFKKLLANAGYVALGGASLFAVLVASAPDLL